jgi:hypothetical protein
MISPSNGSEHTDRPVTEEDIPRLAVMAGRKAFRDAMSAGLPVLIIEDGNLVRVSPDGTTAILRPVSRQEPAHDSQPAASP